MFRRRPQPEPIPIVIVRQRPPRRLPAAIVATIAILALLAVGQVLRLSPAASTPDGPFSSAPGYVPPADPTEEPALASSISAADASYEKRAADNDAKCDAMTDVDKGTACVERSTAIIEEESRFDQCMVGMLHVADVKRCQASAAHP